MPYKEESMLMGKDAPANTSTELCFNPPDGPFGTSNLVEGEITPGDEDWIAIKLTEGNTYTITVVGRATVSRTLDNPNRGTVDNEDEVENSKLKDSVLKLMDGKGGLIKMNDDKDGAKGMLLSELTFTPEEGSGEQVYYISVSGYTGNPAATTNTGGYTVKVTETMFTPGLDIEGTEADEKLTGMDEADRIEGMGGDDVLNGLGGDDMLDGGDGADLLIGGAGADDIKGGADEDTVSYATSPDGVSINLRSGTAAGGDAEGDKLGTDIENIIGSMYDDVLAGSRRPNKILGLGGDDELSGDRADDMLYGGMGDDELYGGDGNDVLEGGPGADELTGGDGKDTASWEGSMMGVTVRLHSRQAMGGDAEGDTWGDTTTVPYTLKDADGKDVEHEETVPDIIHLTGSGMADVLAGDSRDNTIMGGGGDDKIYGGPGGGGDTLHGDGGHDSLFGGIGNDILAGGAGNDKLVGGAGNDTVYGGAGSDMIYADSEDTEINGWLLKYADTDSDGEPDSIYMGPADFVPEIGPNPVDESLEVTNDPMAVDTVSFENSKTGVGTAADARVNLTGTASAGFTISNVENLIGTNENDFLGGSTGNNVIDGLDGADDLDGSEGNDTVSYSKSDRGVTVNLSGETDTASGGHAQGDTISGFENVTGSAHSDNLTGDDTANVLKGLAGDDELEGLAGGDTLEGGAGRDELNGGTNATDADAKNDNGADRDGDTVSYAGSDAAVTVNLATLSFSGGHAEGDEDDGADRDAYDPDGAGPGDPVDVSSFENVTGSDHNDHLTGDHRDNNLTGGKGDDTLRGGASSTAEDNITDVEGGRDNNTGDILHGGPGADYLDGGEDANEKDNMVPGVAGVDDDGDGTTDEEGEMAPASIDVASYAGAMAGVEVNLATGKGTKGDAMGDTLVNIEQVLGSGHDDTFIAGPGADNVVGGGHKTGGDTISYALSPEGVTVSLGVTAPHLTAAQAQPEQGDQDSYASGDILTGIENVIGSDYDDMLTGFDNQQGPGSKLEGKGGDDTLVGGDGTDTIMGGAGDDKINGDSGNDTITGGAGKDDIDGGAGKDTITGGPGNDDMDGGGGRDIFVFSPDGLHGDDARDVDLIQDFKTDLEGTANPSDRIDLTAYGFESDGSDLIPLISLRGTPGQADSELIIDLRSKGGGVIILNGVDDLDRLEVGGGAGNATGANDNEIDELSIWTDTNNNGDPNDPEDGIFIL